MKIMQGMLAAGLLAGSMTAHAADFKLGYIDTPKVFQVTRKAVAINAMLDKEFAARRAELSAIEKRGKQIGGVLARTDLSPDDRKKNERELDALERDFRAKSRELDEDFSQRRTEEFASLQAQANEIVKEIAEKQGFDLILQDAVFVNKKYDITPAVIQALDK